MAQDMTDDERRKARRKAVSKLMVTIDRASGDLENLAIRLEDADADTKTIRHRLYEWAGILHEMRVAVDLDEMDAAQTRAFLVSCGVAGDDLTFDDEREGWADYFGEAEGAND